MTLRWTFLRRLHRHLTFANVVSVVALFVALGGSSYAALRIGSSQIADNSVRSRDIRDGEIRGKDIRSRTVSTSDLDPKALRTIRSPNGAYSVTVTDDGVLLAGPGGTLRLYSSGVDIETTSAAGQRLPVYINRAACVGPVAITLGSTTDSAYVFSTGSSHSHFHRTSNSIFAC